MKWLTILLALAGCCTNSYNNDIGREYLGVKYIADPLGEETAPDLDPLIRTDAFDCTTFVETVLADGNVDSLTKIRYKDGKIGFLNRNHFIETDWLQNNSELVENVSSIYGQTLIREVTIDKQNWLKKVHNIEASFNPQTVYLEYIPYKNVQRFSLSSPMIVLFITGKSEKSDKIGTDLAVVHMGILLPNGILRHASSQFGRVIDVDFYDYALQRAQNKNNIGIALVKIK